jgi:copper chaperone CopZ
MNREFGPTVIAALAALGVCTTLGSIAAVTTAAAHHENEPLQVAAADVETGRTYVLTVEGMSCPTGCAPKVEEALRGIEGVESVEVDFDTKKATVRTSPGRTITQQACDGAMGNSGYFVEAIKEVEATQQGS